MQELEIWLMDKMGYFSGGEYGPVFRKLLTSGYITVILLVIITVIGIKILWNQRKIKKQLRQLLEEQKKESQEERK